jgi:hypothetical protein
MNAKLASLLAVASLAVCTFSAPNSRAESTNCGSGNLIETGYRMDEVLARCGNPSWQQTTMVHNRRAPWMVTRIDEWIYDPGEGSFLRYLRFTNGGLAVIEERSRERT